MITGAGAGLGRAHAVLLASRGAAVVVNDNGVNPSTGRSLAEEVVADIDAAGGRAVADSGSVASASEAEGMVELALTSFGRLDALVNNAGILRPRTLAKLSAEEIDPVLAVHLNGALNVTLPALRHMKRKNHGRVVFTTSEAGLFGHFATGAYGPAKMGVVGLMRAVAIEGATYGVLANAIAPMAATGMSAGGLGAAWTSKLAPELVSPAVALLTHDDCPVTGEIFSVAGGRVARVFLAETQGFFAPALTPEVLLENFDRVLDETGYSVPRNSEDEFDLFVRHTSIGEATPATATP